MLSGAGGLTVGPNVNISRLAGNQAETAIAINPTNPLNLFASSNGQLARFSMDGGLTWADSDVSIIPVSCCDMQAAFDAFGNLFVTYLDLAGSIDSFVARSADGGASFKDPRLVVPDSDQPSVATGPGPTPGTLSVWISVQQGGQIVASGALVTGLDLVGAFTTPQTAPGSGNPTGSFGDTRVGPGGEVLVTYQRPVSGEGPATIQVNLDPDGLGPQGFGPAVIVTETNVGGFDFIPAQPGRSIDAEASLAWDRSGGPTNGRIYLVYTDETAPENSDTDIFLRYSDDDGATWSPRIRVNDDPVDNGKSQFNHAVAVDQTTGLIAITWYDARNSPGNNTAQLFATVSRDGGLTFSPNVLISAGTSNSTVPAVGSFNFGDYDLMDFHAGVFYRTWADNSNSTGDNPDGTLGSLDVYTARVQVGLGVIASLPANGAVVTSPPTSFVIRLSAPYDGSSVLPGDLTVNGIAADSVELTAADTLTFGFDTSPVTAQGLQTLAIAAEAIVGLDGSLILPFSASFRFDAASMQVTSANPPAGAVVEVPFTVLQIHLNEPVAPQSVQASDLTLSRGIVTGFSLLNANTTIQFTLGGLTGEGPLAVGLAPGALTDEFGNPSAAFAADYTLDVGTVPLLASLVAVPPLGSLAYAQAGLIVGVPPPTHVYELNGNFADALGGPSLVPNGGTLSPAGYAFGTGQGPSLSGAIVPDTYSIEMLFFIDSTTSYRKLLDFKDRSSDDGLYNLNTALDFFPVTTGPTGAFTAGQLHHLVVTRDGVTGRFVGYVDGVGQIDFIDSANRAVFSEPNNIIHILRDDMVTTGENPSGFLDRVRIYDVVLTAEQAADLFSSGLSPDGTGGVIAPEGDADRFTLDVDPGQTVSVVVTPTSSALQPTVTVTGPGIVSALATAAGPGRRVVLNVAGVTEGGTYTITVGSAGGDGPYAVQVALGAALELETYAQTGGNDTAAGAQDIDGAFTPLANGASRGAVLGRTDLLLTPDYYAFTADDGESVTLVLEGLNSGSVEVELRDASDALVAAGVAGAANADRFLYNQPLAAGTYFVRVTGGPGVVYGLVVTRGAAFEREGNDTPAAAADLTGTAGVLGHLGADEDWYLVTLAAGQTVVLETRTPGGEPGEFVNRLDPSIELYDPDGTRIVGGTALADGRNESAAFRAAEDATYRIRVVAEGDTAGEYFLSVVASSPAPPRVGGVVVNGGEAQRSAVTRVTVVFDSEVTLDPDALELREATGGGLVDLVVAAVTAGGRTTAEITFTGADLVGGSLAEGSYALIIRGDRIRDSAGVALDGDGDGAPGGDAIAEFFRRFGDVDGNGLVEAEVIFLEDGDPPLEYGGDFGALLGALGTQVGEEGYLAFLDYDADGAIDARDLIAYRIDQVVVRVD